MDLRETGVGTVVVLSRREPVVIAAGPNPSLANTCCHLSLHGKGDIRTKDHDENT